MIGYITRYALTKGIIETELEVSERIPSMVKAPKIGCHAFFHDKDWHHSKDGAIAQANLMRNRKLVSIEKAAKKINGIDFSKIKKI